MVSPTRMGIIIIGAFMFASATVQAQESQAKFQLYTACAPVDLSVGYSPLDEGNLRLDESTIATAVRSRLRSARIYTNKPDPLVSLTVSVYVTGNAYNIQFNFIQVLWNPVTKTAGAAITWIDGNSGTHGYDEGYILEVIRRLVDRFIDEYLEVNDSACE